MKPILDLFARGCFVVCVIFAVASVVLLLTALIFWSRHLLIWAVICVVATIAECFAGFMARAIAEDVD
jgi:hypothetical protein